MKLAASLVLLVLGTALPFALVPLLAWATGGNPWISVSVSVCVAVGFGIAGSELFYRWLEGQPNRKGKVISNAKDRNCGSTGCPDSVRPVQ